MGLKGFLKNLFGGEISEQGVSQEVQKISYSNMEEDFKAEKSDLETKELEIVNETGSKIKSFKEDASEKVKSLEEADVFSKNLEERAKKIIKENLDNYISHYKELFDSLEKIKQKSLSGYLAKADKVLKDFEKKSFKNYQKSAFLFEKRIKDANAVVVDVSNYLKRVSSENSALVKKSEVFSFVDSKLGELKDLRSKEDSYRNSINSCEDNVYSREKEREEILRKIDEVKNSESYKQNSEIQEKINSKMKEIDSEIEVLKKDIDFKSLGNALHKDEKKIQLVKAFKNNFVSKFKEDWGESLRELLDSVGKKDLAKKIDGILDKRQEILDLQNSFEKTGLEALKSELESCNLRIEELKTDKEREEKNLEKASERIKEVEKEIIDNLKSVGFVVE